MLVLTDLGWGVGVGGLFYSVHTVDEFKTRCIFHDVGYISFLLHEGLCITMYSFIT